MARLFWLTFWLALGAALVSGVSWCAAYYSLGTFLGAPPPQMGTQHTRFMWDGLGQRAGAPKVWQFAFGPTSIPGAPSVRIYISPTGKLVATEPGDLPQRIKAFHSQPY
jgi:hypothetical protein